VTFELAQIIAQLVQAIRSFGETEGGEDGLVDVLRGPAADVSTAMQENLEEANDSRVVDFDAGIADRADGDRQRNPLQKREVDVNVEPLGLEASEAAGDDFERLADGIEIVQSLFEAEVVEVVGAELIAQERCELFVLLQEGMLEVGTEDMMAMLNLVDDGGELAGQPAV
jgi:hypothetical protein